MPRQPACTAANAPVRAIGHQHRDAVGDVDPEREAGRVAAQAVGLDLRDAASVSPRAHAHDVGAVNLARDEDPVDAGRDLQATPVLETCARRVAPLHAQVQLSNGGALTPPRRVVKPW